MRYTLLIFMAEDLHESWSDEEREEMLLGHRKLQEKAKAEGKFIAADQLMPSTTATTVRARRKKTAVIDGPFIETKEQLIGLYVLDCEDLDEAIAYAEMIPHAEAGSIEVRPAAYFESYATEAG